MYTVHRNLTSKDIGKETILDTAKWHRSKVMSTDMLMTAADVMHIKSNLNIVLK